uniref:Zinc finger protein RFP-like n=1 Tax=Salvator merianae TaxID=96440 RepID=A0A8D0BPI4_SALMN
MATRNLVKNFSDEAICSICLEYFKDPVTVDCGHNFCQVCITRCLEEAEGKPSCPQCRETISQRNFRPNRQLTNLVELIKNLQQEIQEEEKRGVCGKHQEPLKLFCKEDRICICVVCDRSKEHKDHNVLPLEEAFKEYKVSLYGSLSGLRAPSDNVHPVLHQISNQLDSLKDRIHFHYEQGSELLQSSGNASSKNSDFLPLGFLSPAVSVTLDPDTAHPCLFISEDRSSVKKEDCDQKLPLKPGRFDTMWCVLGCEKFTAGRHYWVVEIKGKQAGWVIGVAQETVKRKGYINFSPEEGIWAIQCCFCKIDNLPQFRISSLTSPLQTIISQSWKLSKIRVSLDYEAGYVAFSDACTGRSIFTFSSACFVEKRVCPFFRVFHGTTLNCC